MSLPAAAKTCFGLFVLFAFYVGGLAITHGFGLPIPAAIVGMLGLLALLAWRRGQLASVRAAADVVLPLIPLFLIPICVSMAMTVPARSASIWLTILTIAVATLVGVVATALVARWLLHDEDAGAA
jgi:holin-like protein